jgi:hypothetical protein
MFAAGNGLFEARLYDARQEEEIVHIAGRILNDVGAAVLGTLDAHQITVDEAKIELAPSFPALLEPSLREILNKNPLFRAKTSPPPG